MILRRRLIQFHRRRGEGDSDVMIWALIVLALAGAAYFVLPNFVFIESSRRPPVARAVSEMRSLATALEAYKVDENAYPAMHPLRNFVGMKGSDSEQALMKAGGWDLHTVEPGNAFLKGLTTPVSYIVGLHTDYFLRDKHDKIVVPFAYYNANNQGWILFSTGPDGAYNIDPAVDYDPALADPKPPLLLKSYDATNGTNSRGDVWRIKQ